MFKEVFGGIFLFKIVLVFTKEVELPLCPTNISYFPQNLPMHCRMPTNADFPGFSALPAGPENQSPSSDKQSPLPVPYPIPPGFPGPIPGAMPMPGPMAGPMPMQGPVAIPGPIGPSGPMPFPGPAHKLPVIVMPFYSPDPSFKKTARPNYSQHSIRPRKVRIRHRRRRPFIYSHHTITDDTEISSESSSSSSSEDQGWWKGKRSHRRFNGPMRMKKKKRFQKRQLLTPVLQYVTKDGYVIFEKKISKTEAKDWLNVKKDEKLEISTRVSPEARDMESNEPNEDHTAEKETITEDNVEVITKRNSHRNNRVKAHREKLAQRKLFERPR